MKKTVAISRWLPAALIVLAAVLAYWNSFDGVFVYDDIASIRDNPHIHKLWPLSEAMSIPLWSSATTVDGRPMLSLTFALNHKFLGAGPWGYHLVNLIIHILAGLLLFGIVRRTLDLPRFRDRYRGRAVWLALAVALIWVVHPLNTEAVTYIVQRAESLMGLLFLLTLYSAIRAFTASEGFVVRGAWCVVGGEDDVSNRKQRTKNNEPSSGNQERRTKNAAARWRIAAVAACAIGMAVKQTMFSAPLLVLIYDWIFVSGSPGKALTKRKWFYASLFATWLIVFGIIVATWKESTIDFIKINPLHYLLTQALVLLTYLRLAIWPSPLMLSYGWTLEDQWPRIVFPGLAVLGMLAIMFQGIRRRRWYGFVLGWFFFILAPTSSIAPMRQALFEHRMYLSLGAIVVMIVLGSEYVLSRCVGKQKWRLILGGCLVAAVTLTLGYLTHNRNDDYSSEIGMWRDNLAHQPESLIAQNNLGNALHHLGRNEEAIQHYRKALGMDPTYAQAHYNIAVALEATGRTREAITCYRRAISLYPGFADAMNGLGNALKALGFTGEAIAQYREAVRVMPANESAHYNLGIALQAEGRLKEAIASYEQALKLSPDLAKVHYNLGNALQALGRNGDALAHYRKAILLKPEYTKAFNNMGNALVAQGKQGDAIPCYREALRLSPGSAEINYNLGRALMGVGRVEDAISSYEQSLRLSPDFVAAHYNLGNALVVLGRTEEAIAQYQHAVRLKPDHIGAHNNLGFLYRESGQLAEAVRHFEQALRLDPNNGVAKENLRQTKQMLEGGG